MIIKRRVNGSVIDFELTKAELEQAFREHEKEYLMNDAARHCEEEDFADYDENDLSTLAEQFMKRKDCNRADNDTWYEIITQYFNNR